MICEKGNIKLVDFSISKRLPTKSAMTSTFCGTAEYMAPEIIFGTRYGIEVDWWSLGILLYELSVKQLPYTGSISDIQNSIMTQPPVFPSSIEPTLQRFISELLIKNGQKRLGSNFDDVKNHVFFNSICWNDLENGHLQPPFLPDPTKIYN